MFNRVNLVPGSVLRSRPHWRFIATRKRSSASDQVVGVLGVLAEVDLHPEHTAGELVVSRLRSRR